MGRELEDLESVDTQVWLNQIHPEERNKIWGDFEKYLEKGENFHLEYRLRVIGFPLNLWVGSQVGT
ncbi:MAG: PAS domain-containing protein [Methanosarcina flavescens]|jgi:hypothetical protein|uniref:PAS domain-containing protein n=2 Tax=Methanosarcina flavescens TaxID=1715806 RepID=A0A660HV20_9EURY|nr:hypothetical protein AOB57_014420 [Methanosarcina flavescens]NLK31770.1 PAS domain-containing protein [Methanosarcina flavescens]